MSIRRKFILFVCTAICAFAVMAPSPSHDLGSIESAAPSYGPTLASLEPVTEEAGMAALRQQANLALAQLQTTEH
jgi:hypothetical protein